MFHMLSQASCFNAHAKAVILMVGSMQLLTLLHSERPKLYIILAFLSAIGFRLSEFGDLGW